MNPVTWISKYRQNSIPYLTVMVLFYHLIGFVIMIMGSIIVDFVVNNYTEPTIPLTGISVIFAGPFEESIFFGIPFYLTGNNLVTLIGGIIWATLHVLNTPSVQAKQSCLSNMAICNTINICKSQNLDKWKGMVCDNLTLNMEFDFLCGWVYEWRICLSYI